MHTILPFAIPFLTIGKKNNEAAEHDKIALPCPVDPLDNKNFNPLGALKTLLAYQPVAVGRTK
jgi:hypothetical protein